MLDDMTFDAPTTAHVPVCDLHGPDCLGHAWRVEA